MTAAAGRIAKFTGNGNTRKLSGFFRISLIDFEYQRFLAGGCTNLGGILAEQSRFPGGRANPAAGRRAEYRALQPRYPDDEEIRFDLGNCHFNLGYLQLKLGRADEALASAERSTEICWSPAPYEPQDSRLSPHHGLGMPPSSRGSGCTGPPRCRGGLSRMVVDQRESGHPVPRERALSN